MEVVLRRTLMPGFSLTLPSAGALGFPSPASGEGRSERRHVVRIVLRQVAAGAAFGEADLQRQAIARIGLGQRLLELDGAFLVELEKRLVEGLHAFLQAALHRVLDLMYRSEEHTSE